MYMFRVCDDSLFCAQVRQIASNAQQMAREQLQGEDVFCYHVMLFNVGEIGLVIRVVR